MVKALLNKIRPAKKNVRSTKFSKFFREASSREKKRVFMDVARKANIEQQKIIRAYGSN